MGGIVAGQLPVCIGRAPESCLSFACCPISALLSGFSSAFWMAFVTWTIIPGPASVHACVMKHDMTHASSAYHQLRQVLWCTKSLSNQPRPDWVQRTSMGESEAALQRVGGAGV